MSYETQIKNLLNNQSMPESQLLSIRMPPSTVNQIDELASELDRTRSELITVFINGGISELVRQLEEKDNNNKEEDIIEARDNEESPRYFLLNTNYNNSESDHFTMLENGEASAFYGNWKKNIKNLKENDVVFLYHSGHGICGYGYADKELIIRDHNGNKEQWYARKLHNFVSDFKVITAKVCKDITKSNLIFRKTMVPLTKEQGKAIITKINESIK
ncbi:hypothetical protein SAMN05216419_10537 [Nitrosomonas cryotolerans]|uniref:Uncharacterized protein n=1 Tax=Nitrosomonas cryotolerans ATCC 49181 TaxID=1131553 RepID=A0A1N6GAW8_9PROT|nr:CopG family transcriptional regulator [Nitrosomonas cryotolerans]SFQ06080.1 hypothetical protein SAMN05216419_10537 [Nitrosomonas cryotolerans]SIO04658.1 hypothetical protein SAMN02743940_0628 [Nitrosomonas cryotolerans ATCC 49181]